MSERTWPTLEEQFRWQCNPDGLADLHAGPAEAVLDALEKRVRELSERPERKEQHW